MAQTTQFATNDWEDDPAEIAFLINLFQQRRNRRVNFESGWEENALLAWPEHSGSFFFGRDISPGVKRSQYQLSSVTQIARHRFGAIADYLITPSSAVWSVIKDNDPYLMKQPGVTAWYSAVTKTLWRERYKPTANFTMQNQANMQGLGVYGNMAMFTDELDNYLDPKERGLRYLGCPIGEWYLLLDHQQRVVGGIRHFRLNAQQAKVKWPERSVPVIEAALKISSPQLFDFLHFIRPNTDYHPEFMLNPKRRWKYESIYMSFQGQCILERGGYRTLPLAYGRYEVAPDEDHGRGPMDMAKASSKTHNSMKRVHLKAGHRGADPTYLVGDPGLIDFKSNPGEWNAGGMSPDGKPLVGVLPTGNVQITKEMMDDEVAEINDAFLVSLFKLILDNPKGMPDARQIEEYIHERGILLFPTIGGQNSQYCGYIIDRELDILSWQRKLPPLPPALREQGVHHEIVYCNPIARAMQAQTGAGYVRTMEFAQAAAQATGDPSLMDYFAWDRSIPGMGEQNYAPAEWFSTDKEVAAIRKGRAQQQERERQVKELPGKAAIIKAQAVQTKAATGGNIGGTLSGVPAGQMPLMPGQNQQ